MTPKSSNDKDYTWTFKDVRDLDSRLLSIENKIDSNYKSFKEDVKDIKESIKSSHLIIDNTNKTDWKAIGIIIGATVAAILAAIQQVVK